MPPSSPPTDEFTEQAHQYRRELTAHCYRMLGSVHDAEDLVQETYLRAWRSYGSFENRSSMRTWLYRIATNACLTALDGKQRRPLPSGLGGESSDPDAPLVQNLEVPWLEPAPDALVGADADPAAAVTSRESIRLAFIAALQFLPPRQLAVLVLRDVLNWSAAEVADAVGTSVAAVNSALQRARAQLREIASEELVEPQEPEQRELLDRYVQAFWNKDIAALTTMFTDTAVWEMPPFTGWYQGPESIAHLIDLNCPGGIHDMPMVPTRANGQPAFGLYMRQPDGHFDPFQLQVLTVRGGAITHVAAFFASIEPKLFERFSLPASIPATLTPAG
jgi:RNA polymerase sigma-70 factor (ECF subfamily)